MNLLLPGQLLIICLTLAFPFPWTKTQMDLYLKL